MPELYFFSTKVCTVCHFNLEEEMPLSWEIQTGCPNCKRTFVD